MSGARDGKTLGAEEATGSGRIGDDSLLFRGGTTRELLAYPNYCATTDSSRSGSPSFDDAPSDDPGSRSTGQAHPWSDVRERRSRAHRSATTRDAS
jgi:hypothetical protein